MSGAVQTSLMLQTLKHTGMTRRFLSCKILSAAGVVGPFAPSAMICEIDIATLLKTDQISRPSDTSKSK